VIPRRVKESGPHAKTNHHLAKAAKTAEKDEVKRFGKATIVMS
jgi:hypothetical protein